MAIKKKKHIGIIDFIHPSDGAIDTEIDDITGEPKSDIEAYKEDWDFEKHCSLREDVKPTIFKINFSIPYKKAIAIKNASLGGFGKGQEAGFMLGNHSNQVVRSVLVGIENPDDMPEDEKIIFKRTDNNLVSEETMNDLEHLDIVDDIYSFWMKHKGDSDDIKKK